MSKLRPITCSQGEFDSIKSAAKHFGVATSTIQGRLSKGWSMDDALGIVERQKRTTGKKLVSSVGTFSSLRDAASKLGIKAENISNRLSLGWTVDEALEITKRTVRHPSRGKKIECDGVKFNSIAEFADYYEINHQQNKKTTRKRLYSGWTPEQAVGIDERPPRFRNKDGGVRDHAWIKKTVNKSGEIVPDSSTGEYNLYLITNLENSKEYVGLTTGNLKKRLRGHWNMVSRGRHSKLYNAMRKSLRENGDKSGIQIVLIRNDAKSIDELQEQEAQEIVNRDTLENGYNTAFGGAIGTPKPIEVDGELFVSRSSAAEYFGIDVALANLRLSRLGWTPEQAFELDKSKILKQTIKVEGCEYQSIQSACKAYDLKYKTVYRRLKHSNWTIEEAFELVQPPKKQQTVHNAEPIVMNGKSYKSMAELGRFIGVTSVTVKNRIESGWTERQIVGIDPPPKKRNNANNKSITVEGVKYPSIKSASEAYGIDHKIVHQRLTRSKWTIDEAFQLKLPPDKIDK